MPSHFSLKSSESIAMKKARNVHIFSWPYFQDNCFDEVQIAVSQVVCINGMCNYA